MSFPSEHLSPAGHALLDRRRFLGSSATALGSIALTNLLGADGLLAADRPIIDPARPDTKIHFTVSIGVSEIHRSGDAGSALVERADRALYGAKRTGKNTVLSENEVPNEAAATVTARK